MVPVGTYAVGSQISVSADLLVLGVNGAVVDGGNSGRLFFINGNNDVSFSALRIKNGNTSIGGAIYNLNGTVTLASVTLEDNIGVTGGAIYNLGTLIINNNSQIRRNIADGTMTTARGGAIYNAGKLTIDNSDFISNTVQAASSGTVDAFGGAIYNLNRVIITNTSTLQLNSALATNADTAMGGAIYNSGSITISHATLSSNTTSSINSTENRGGGIYNSSGSTLTVQNATLSNNLATGNDDSRGGAIYNVGQLRLKGSSCVLTGNKADPFSASLTGEGGAIYNSGDMQVNDCAISLNEADDHGGGIYNGGIINTLVEDVFFFDNDTPNGAGGGIYNNQSGGTLLSIIGAIFRLNDADTAGGGVAHEGGDLGILLSELSNNTAGTSGGALWMTGGGSVGVNASNLFLNQSSNTGGAIGVSSAQLGIISTDISTNTARLGGGLYTGGGVTINVELSAFFDNSASEDGGAINTAGVLNVVNSTFSRNRADNDGGAIHGDPMLSNVTIVENRADDDGNGLGDGGGISGFPTAQNTILADNVDVFGEAPDCAGELTSTGYNLLGTLVGCSVVGDTTGNMVGVPLLLDSLKPGVYLTAFHNPLPGSPAISGGNIAGCTDNDATPLLFDQRGELRPQGPLCDIGAVELVCVVPVPPEISGSKNGNDVDLMWTSHSENDTHEVWRSDIPNFEIGVDLAMMLDGDVPGTTYTDANVLISLSTSVYYRVRGKNICGTASSVANEQLGVFIFEITPGN